MFVHFKNHKKKSLNIFAIKQIMLLYLVTILVIASNAVDTGEVQKTETKTTQAQKTEVQKTEVQKTEVKKTEVKKTESVQTKPPIKGDCMPKLFAATVGDTKACKIYYCTKSQTDGGEVQRTEYKQTQAECLASGQTCIAAIKQIGLCKDALYYAGLQENSCSGLNLDTTTSDSTTKGLWPVPDKYGRCYCQKCIKSDSTTVDENTSSVDDVICCKTTTVVSGVTKYTYEKAKKGLRICVRLM